MKLVRTPMMASTWSFLDAAPGMNANANRKNVIDIQNNEL